MTLLDTTTFEALFKTRYPDKRIEANLYKDRPFLALIPKMSTFTGDQIKQPVVYGNPQNTSNTFATAIAGTSSSSQDAFFVTRARCYSKFGIENEVIMASESDEGAFLRAFDWEMDRALDSLGRRLSIQLHREGTGVVGQLANSSVATTVWTLSNPDDIVNIEVNMQLVLSTANGGGAVKSGVAYVITVDRDAGTFTCSATLGGSAANISTIIATAATTDYIFPNGDYDLAIDGFQSWIPVGSGRSAALSASYFGVTRSADSERLGGIYKDYSSLSPEEAITSTMSRFKRSGINPDYIFCNPSFFLSLNNALGSRVQYIDLKAGTDGAISFRGILVNGANGVVKVVQDQDVPSGYFHVATLNTWELSTLGKTLQLFNTDGLQVLRSDSFDGVTGRFFMYGNARCKMPGSNGAVKIA